MQLYGHFWRCVGDCVLYNEPINFSCTSKISCSRNFYQNYINNLNLSYICFSQINESCRVMPISGVEFYMKTSWVIQNLIMLKTYFVYLTIFKKAIIMRIILLCFFTIKIKLNILNFNIHMYVHL